jgi:hypothetical protein
MCWQYHMKHLLRLFKTVGGGAVMMAASSSGGCQSGASLACFVLVWHGTSEGWLAASRENGAASVYERANAGMGACCMMDRMLVGQAAPRQVFNTRSCRARAMHLRCRGCLACREGHRGTPNMMEIMMARAIRAAIATPRHMYRGLMLLHTTHATCRRAHFPWSAHSYLNWQA